MAKVLMVIAPANFKDEEYFGTRRILEEEGVEVDVANSTGKQSVSSRGKAAEVHIKLENVHDRDYDGIIFAGGSGSSFYFDYQIALDLVRKFFESGKLVGAICIAPTILARAGILNGKKATAFTSQVDSIKSVATYTDKDVEQDGNIFTCKWPTVVPEFSRRVAEYLRGHGKPA